MTYQAMFPGRRLVDGRRGISCAINGAVSHSLQMFIQLQEPGGRYGRTSIYMVLWSQMFSRANYIFHNTISYLLLSLRLLFLVRVRHKLPSQLPSWSHPSSRPRQVYTVSIKNIDDKVIYVDIMRSVESSVPVDNGASRVTSRISRSVSAQSF